MADTSVPPQASTPASGSGRLTTLLTATGGAVLALAGARAARGILAPTLLGLVIVVTVYPLATWLRRHRMPGWLAMVATMLVSYGVIVVLVGGTMLSLAVFVGLLPKYADSFTTVQHAVVTWLAGLGITTTDLGDAVSGISPGQIAGTMRSAAGSVGSVLSAVILMLTVTFFIVLDTAGFPDRLAVVARSRPELVRAFGQFAHGTRTYVLVATVFGGVVALADTIMLFWLGIPYPWIWGLLAFLTGYIPNIGFLIGLVPVAVLGLLHGGWSVLVIVVVGYCVINFVLQSLIQPKFVGDSVGLATTVTFLSLAFWTLVLGALGTILAVPLTLLAKAVLLGTDPNKEWAVALISSTPHERAEGRVVALDEFAADVDEFAADPPDEEPP